MIGSTNSSCCNIHHRATIHDGLITATIYALTDGTAVNIHRHIALRRTVHVVTSKHIMSTTALHVHRHSTIDVSCIAGITQTAAIYITSNGSTIEVHLRFLFCRYRECRTLCRSALRGIHLTLGTATINITRDVGIADIVWRSFSTSISTNVHLHVASDCRCLTIATTEDISSDIDIQ